MNEVSAKQELINEFLEELENTSAQKRGIRRRSPTLLKLQWLAERVRKCEKIKNEIARGSYRVDSRAVAKRLLNLDMNEEPGC